MAVIFSFIVHRTDRLDDDAFSPLRSSFIRFCITFYYSVIVQLKSRRTQFYFFIVI